MHAHPSLHPRRHPVYFSQHLKRSYDDHGKTNSLNLAGVLRRLSVQTKSGGLGAGVKTAARIV